MHQYNWDKSTKFWSVEKYNFYIKCDYKYLISVIFIRKQNYHNCIYSQVINRTVSIKENKNNYHNCIYYEVKNRTVSRKEYLRKQRMIVTRGVNDVRWSFRQSLQWFWFHPKMCRIQVLLLDFFKHKKLKTSLYFILTHMIMLHLLYER